MNWKRIYLAVLLCSISSTAFSASSVRINEIMAFPTLQDEDGQLSDWIELYNSGVESVNLQEWFLSDDPTQPRKWEFPPVDLPAGGYLIVYASGKNRSTPNLHANFSLNSSGEYLGLYFPDGTVASEFNPTYPGQKDGYSYGYDSGSNLAFLKPSSPGAANSGGVIDFVKDTKFSQSRGFFDAPFDLTITTGTVGATIRYTTNGVPPTAVSGIIYTGPIPIRGTTTIRAAAFKTGLQPSNVDTESYIFLQDVIHQAPTGAAPPGWPSSWGANVVDYGMDPNIVNDPHYKDTIQNDLKTIPSFSIVMKLGDLFDPTTGIYANPSQDTRTWERPCSIELIYPDGSKGFQIDAGLRIRGGFSRSTGNPKHAFRFFFRTDYGAGKLNYPLFGDEGASTFDGVDLRTFQNYSWSFQGDGNGIFLRDQFSRDTQLEMGYNAERGNFYHLYINGQYWGLYNTCERPEASYAETYFGGAKTDYDVIKVAPESDYSIYATDGNMLAWTSLYNQAKAGLSTDDAYQKLLGNNPDGTPNPAYPVLLDVDNLIDYMLVILYTGNLDAPISNFLGNEKPNNWFGIRNRNPGVREGFRFFAHDSEHTLLTWEINRDRTGPFPAGDAGVAKSNPQWIWQRLAANAEFRMRVADHIQKHFFNGGALTPEQNIARFMRRKNEIDRAVVGESARWGDAKVATAYTRDGTWVAAINNVLNNFFPQRSQIVLNQLKAKNLYPAVAAPSFNQQGGNVNSGFTLTMTAPAADIYYTLDGSDPRLRGGALSSKAVLYSSPVVLDENVKVSARVFNAGTWSAINQVDFSIIRDFKDLLITELMYNPPSFQNFDGDQFEFIELKNVGSTVLDLSGIQFTNGISYRFPNGTHLAAGSFYVLVSNPTNYAAKYPGKQIDGVYQGNLSNSGEALALIHAAGAPIAQFNYGDKAPWPTTPDGNGFSLVLNTPNPNVDYTNPLNWRASAMAGGSPGADDPPVNIPPVVINEVLTHTDPPQLDAIELYNPTDAPADISGWYLTDSSSNPRKFQLPAGTILPAHAYQVFNETEFNSVPGLLPSFSLDSHGEEVFIFSAFGTNLTGYSQGFVFGAAQNGVSFGRYTNSSGDIFYPAQKQLTLGSENTGPVIGPVVFNEIQYHPQLGSDEFLELKNISNTPVKLYDPLHPTNTWKISGLNFTFPQSVEIPANGLLVLCGIEPSFFRDKYQVPTNVAVVGPYSGNLQDNGELLELVRPDNPDTNTNGTGLVPYIVTDSVRYNNHVPWPEIADGAGASLEKITASAFGNDPAAWRGSIGEPSPGLENDGNRRPIVNAGADLSLVSTSFPLVTNLNGTVTDDGLPSPSSIHYLWTIVSGPGVVQIDNSQEATASFAFPGVGTYVLKLIASDGELQASDTRIVTISRPLSQATFVPQGSVWKYLDDGSNQGTAWSAPSFVDSSWNSGPAQLGYGDGDEATVVSYGLSSGNKFITTYFRKNFNITGARNVSELTLKLLRDDGAVVYLNGKEVYRANMPSGAISYQSIASSAVGGGDESTFFQTALDPTSLVEGNNLLAVEIHQSAGSSTDISFDLELSGLANFANHPPSANAGADLSISLPADASLSASAADDGLPSSPGVFTVGWSIVSGPGNVTFSNANALQTTASFSQAGNYVLRISVTDGEFTTTDDVAVTVGGGDAYTLWKNAHFTTAELTDQTISGDFADPDGDFFTNQQEFVAGTDPRNADSYLHVETVTRENDDFILTFQAEGDKSYTILGRDNAENGEWERVLDLSPQGSTKPLDILDPVMGNKTRRFYRIVTPQVPQPN